MIPVAKPYLPDQKKFIKYVGQIYDSGRLTNGGPLVRQLTERLQEYLGVEHLLLLSNGTLALQVAYKALGLTKQKFGGTAEIITTPFTFIATASSIQWEGLEPIFADIDAKTWCLDPKKIESAITQRTRAIVPVHVFGNACGVERIQEIADRHKLKVIYDAAHAFNVHYKGASLLGWGDAATLSFHATKVFHTVEGGAIVFRNKEDLESARKIINFGITGPDKIECLGINAKMNELQAAMGLCVLDEMEANLKARKQHWDAYVQELRDIVILQSRTEGTSNNYSYFPILLPSEQILKKVQGKLEEQGVSVRRYFYPSLDKMEFLSGDGEFPTASEIARNILCLPLYAGLQGADRSRICKIIMEACGG